MTALESLFAQLPRIGDAPPPSPHTIGDIPTSLDIKIGEARIASDSDIRFIAVDVETANESRSSICQIGIAAVADDNSIHTLSALIYPEEPIAPRFTAIHGITDEMVEDAPDFREVIEVMRPALEANTLVQHSSFDKIALDAACRAYQIPKINADWLDSVMIARRAWPEFTGKGRGKGGHGLANLKKKLGLNFKHHDAEEDARAAAEIVLRAEERMEMPFDKIHAITRESKAHPANFAIEGNPNGPLFGAVACFTGQLTMTRANAASHAAKAGIEVKKSVTQATTLLIVGDQDLRLLAGHKKSGKHRKAEDLVAKGQKIRIIGETEFLALLGKT